MTRRFQNTAHTGIAPVRMLTGRCPPRYVEKCPNWDREISGYRQEEWMTTTPDISGYVAYFRWWRIIGRRFKLSSTAAKPSTTGSTVLDWLCACKNKILVDKAMLYPRHHIVMGFHRTGASTHVKFSTRPTQELVVIRKVQREHERVDCKEACVNFL